MNNLNSSPIDLSHLGTSIKAAIAAETIVPVKKTAQADLEISEL